MTQERSPESSGSKALVAQILTRNGLAALCLIGAVITAATGHDGWGWMLFVGLLIYV